MGRPFDKAQGRPLRLLNLVLGLVAVLITAALAKAWIAPAPFVSNPAAPRSSQELAVISFDRPARPPLEQFDSLLEKNPFKQPPPSPVARPGLTPPPPPRPLPTLSGTMLVGDDWRAIVSDKGKAEIYAIGQEVGGAVITEIKEDRIVLKRGEDTAEVLLKAAIQPAPPAAAGQAPPRAQPVSIPLSPPTVGPPSSTGPKNVSNVSYDSYEKQRLKEEKKAEKERRKALRKNR